MGDSLEMGDKVAELEHASDEDQSPGKPREGHAERPHVSRIALPEILQKYTKEERDELETKLKRKIDFRLMPAIIIMYILNYIDRYVLVLCFFPPIVRPLMDLPETTSLPPSSLV
jgi:hypothetical protein